jgi:predicted TIM-barrel fold metal-dependent hydrolase
VRALHARSDAPRLHDGVLTLAGEGDFTIDPADYGLDARLSALDRAEIDRAVVSCPPTLGIELLPPDEARALLDAYHEGAVEEVEASHGRLLALSMATPQDGFVGTSVAARDLADLEQLAPTLDELERRGSFLFVHPGPADPPADAPVWWAAVVDYTAQMQRAYAQWLAHGIERWPKLRVVFAILAGGAAFHLERLKARGGDERTAFHPTLYLETSSYGRRALELCFATFGASQVLYGSDAPVLDPQASLEPIRSFGHAMSEALCRDNPTSLLT